MYNHHLTELQTYSFTDLKLLYVFYVQFRKVSQLRFQRLHGNFYYYVLREFFFIHKLCVIESKEFAKMLLNITD